MFFSSNLQFFMERYKIDGIRLAKMLNVSDAAVSTWVLGKSYPKMSLIFQLKDIFKTTLDEFFFTDIRKNQSSFDETDYEDLTVQKFIEQSVNETVAPYVSKISKEENLYRELINGRDREIKVLNELIKYLKSQIEDLKK